MEGLECSSRGGAKDSSGIGPNVVSVLLPKTDGGVGGHKTKEQMQDRCKANPWYSWCTTKTSSTPHIECGRCEGPPKYLPDIRDVTYFPFPACVAGPHKAQRAAG